MSRHYVSELSKIGQKFMWQLPPLKWCLDGRKVSLKLILVILISVIVPLDGT